MCKINNSCRRSTTTFTTTKAEHQFGGGLSCLEYWINNEKVVPENLGIFLSKSWRMEPSITSIVSDLFYEGKLKAMKKIIEIK